MFIDWLIIGLYLLCITLSGTWAARKVKSSSTFFISDRTFGKVMMTLFAFGTGTNVSSPNLTQAEIVVFWQDITAGRRQ